MASAKRHASGVGGASLIIDFGDDGTLTEFNEEPYLKLLEDYFSVYHKHTWNLALAMMQPGVTDETFVHSLELFNETIMSDRQKWNDAQRSHQKLRSAYRSSLAQKRN